MKRFTLVAVLMLLWLAPSVHGDNTGKIAGRVVDASTGNPLQYVNVWIPDVKMGAVSEMSGDYCLNGVPPGDYTVQALRPGHTHLETTNVRVVAGQTTTLDLSLWFRGWGAIRGRVVYSGSTDGIPFAKVHIFPTNHRVLRQKADRQGYYSIPYFPAGVCSVRASHGLFESQTVSMHVAAGETTTVDFSLGPKYIGFCVIQGVVSDSMTGNRKPVPDATVTITRIPLYDTKLFKSVHSGKSGDYSFPVILPGRYLLVAGRHGYSTVASAEFQISLEDTVNLHFSLSPLPDSVGRICGLVVDDATGQPLPFVTIWLPETKAGVLTGLSGYYCSRNLLPGTYKVTARMLGFAQIGRTDIRVVANQTTRVDFRLRMSATKLE